MRYARSACFQIQKQLPHDSCRGRQNARPDSCDPPRQTHRGHSSPSPSPIKTWLGCMKASMEVSGDLVKPIRAFSRSGRAVKSVFIWEAHHLHNRGRPRIKKPFPNGSTRHSPRLRFTKRRSILPSPRVTTHAPLVEISIPRHSNHLTQFPRPIPAPEPLYSDMHAFFHNLTDSPERPFPEIGFAPSFLFCKFPGRSRI
jgi:hypothetical protein